MSLIQEALEKVGKARLEEQNKNTASAKTVMPPSQTQAVSTVLPVKQESRPAQEAEPVIEPKLEKKLTALSDETFIHQKISGGKQSFYLKMGILAVLSVVLIGTFFMLQFLMPRIEESAQKRAAISVKPVPAAPAKVEKKESFSFIPRFSKANPAEIFNLSGITVSGGQPLALINNQVVGVGDNLKENAVVKDIQASKVILEYQGREVILSMR